MPELSSRHGPVMLFQLGAVPTLVVSLAEPARESHDAAFVSRHLTPTLDALSIGDRDIPFSPYSELWCQLRRICVLELFSSRRVQSFCRIREEEPAALFRYVADSCAAAARGGHGGDAVVDIDSAVPVNNQSAGGRQGERQENPAFTATQGAGQGSAFHSQTRA